jgi:hypothetical protein
MMVFTLKTNFCFFCISSCIKNHYFNTAHELFTQPNIAVEPVLQDHINDGHGATGPLIVIGFLAGEPVYRTIHTVAHRKNAFF